MGDVARLAGVSVQTVSRVATGSEHVRPDTREKVQRAMNKLGYSPNRAAQALRVDGHRGRAAVRRPYVDVLMILEILSKVLFSRENLTKLMR